tara:strand:- start:21062 stop:21316 length:255 start_codon:yes stop_codon:yes gene_type:complete
MTIPFEYLIEAYVKHQIRRMSSGEIKARLTACMIEDTSGGLEPKIATEANLKDEIIERYDIETLDKILAESESLMNEDNMFATD